MIPIRASRPRARCPPPPPPPPPSAMQDRSSPLRLPVMASFVHDTASRCQAMDGEQGAYRACVPVRPRGLASTRTHYTESSPFDGLHSAGPPLSPSQRPRRPLPLAASPPVGPAAGPEHRQQPGRLGRRREHSRFGHSNVNGMVMGVRRVTARPGPCRARRRSPGGPSRSRG